MFFSSFLVDIIMKALTQHIKNAISGQIRVLLECFLQWLMEANTAAIKRKQNGKMKREWDGFFPAQGNKSERADVRPKWKQSCDARKLCYSKWLTKKISIENPTWHENTKRRFTKKIKKNHLDILFHVDRRR